MAPHGGGQSLRYREMRMARTGKKRSNAREMRRLEKDLFAKRNQLCRQIEQQRAGMLTGSDPDDEGAAAVSSIEKELAASTMDRAMRSLTEVEAALKSIESGHYGVCTHCGQHISEARLKALPWTRLCVECAGGGVKHDAPGVHPQITTSALAALGAGAKSRAR